MDTIDLQNKARPLPGHIEQHWFENPAIGLPRTRFFRIVLPFAPFDSGLDFVEQPELTELVLDWIQLDVEEPVRFDGLTLRSEELPEMEASLYLGAAHNWTVIEELKSERRRR